MKKSLIIIATLIPILAFASGCNERKEVKEGKIIQEPTIEGEAEVSAEEATTINKEKGGNNEKEKNMKVLDYKTYEDPTTGWMVFESLDKELKFSFKYPKDFRIDDQKRLLNQNTGNIVLFVIRKSFGDIYEDFGISISYNKLTIENSKTMLTDSPPFEVIDSRQCQTRKIYRKKIEFQYYPAFSKIITCAKPYEGYQGYHKTIFFKKGDNIWTISAQILFKDQKEQEKIFNDFIDTFKVN